MVDELYVKEGQEFRPASISEVREFLADHGIVSSYQPKLPQFASFCQEDKGKL